MAYAIPMISTTYDMETYVINYHHEDDRLLLLFTFLMSYCTLATLTLSDYCTRFAYLFVYGTRVILLLSPYAGSRFVCKLGHVPRIRKHTLLVYNAMTTTDFMFCLSQRTAFPITGGCVYLSAARNFTKTNRRRRRRVCIIIIMIITAVRKDLRSHDDGTTRHWLSRNTHRRR